MGLGGKHGVQVLAGLGIARLESQGFLELMDRLVRLAFPDEGQAQVVVGLGVVGLRFQGGFNAADGFFDLAFTSEGQAEVIVGVGVAGVQAGGFLVLGDRLVNLAFTAEGDAEVVVGLGVMIASAVRIDCAGRPLSRRTNTSAIAARTTKPAATGDIGEDVGPRTTVPALTKSVSMKE